MNSITDKSEVMVIGLDKNSLEACRLLSATGARLRVVTEKSLRELSLEVDPFLALGCTVETSVAKLPEPKADFVVSSCSKNDERNLLRQAVAANLRVLSDLEVAAHEAKCLTITVSGTNGKTTCLELIERILARSQKNILMAGPSSISFCAAAQKSHDLDFIALEADAAQVRFTETFRTSIAVLTNLAWDGRSDFQNQTEYATAAARLFANQESFDWAIVQSEALAQLTLLGVPLPGKVISFSATNQRADIYLDRGLIISRRPEWAGPLLDMDHCQLRGLHNAENVMATLAVARALRLPLEEVTEAIKSYQPTKHRCVEIGEWNGITFVDDSKASNLDAVQKAILSMPSERAGEPNVWLIAGGEDRGLEYHDLAPVLVRRVKHAFLLGETRDKIRAAWSLFTPCSVVETLLEAVNKAAESAVPGDVVLLSPASSTSDMFHDYQHRGELFKAAFEMLKQKVQLNEPVETN